jgi:hypothetical protein
MKPTSPSNPIDFDFDEEMLLAAAEAHPSWEVIPDGVRYLGPSGPKTPDELLKWFRKKGRH